MGQLLLIVVVAVTVAAVVFGVTVLVSGRDAGLQPAEPDGRALPLPTTRPLEETDLGEVRFDLATRGYRMAQVDQAMRRAAYDIGYKDELIGVLEAEVGALREGRVLDADALRRAREAAQAPATPPAVGTEPAKRGWTEFTRPAEDDEIAPEPATAEAASTSTVEPVADPAAEPETEPATEPAASVAEPIESPPPAVEAVTPEPVAAQPLDQPPADQAVAAEAAAKAEPAVVEPAAAESASTEAGQPAEEAVAPVKARTPARRAATRTSRPTKRSTASTDHADVSASAEDADSVKQPDEAETSSAVATPTEDAGSARR
jgi:DivIVA domain-containing protein